jgi:hypothetical protein
MRFAILVVFVLLILGTLPYHTYSAGWGWGPSGSLGAVLVVLLILVLLGLI